METPPTKSASDIAKDMPASHLHGHDPDEIEPRILMLREAFVATGQWWGAALCERSLCAYLGRGDARDAYSEGRHNGSAEASGLDYGSGIY